MRRKPNLKKSFAPVIAMELASIGAIDSAMPHEREPGYVVLLRSAKSAKQANVEQLLAMLRLAGITVPVAPSKLEPVLKMQTATTVRLGTMPLLGAMLLAERMIAARYEALVGTLDGLFARGIEKCWHRARKQVVILTAHLAVRGGRVCFRCLFDRPGHRPALERSDPHPYTYVCSACHDEVLSDLPADLVDSAERWPERERENIVLEHALGRVSKLKAELKVVNELADLASDLPAPPLPRKTAIDMAPRRKAKKHAAIAILGVDDTAPDERAYIERLFDPEAVQESW